MKIQIFGVEMNIDRHIENNYKVVCIKEYNVVEDPKRFEGYVYNNQVP